MVQRQVTPAPWDPFTPPSSAPLFFTSTLSPPAFPSSLIHFAADCCLRSSPADRLMGRWRGGWSRLQSCVWYRRKVGRMSPSLLKERWVGPDLRLLPHPALLPGVLYVRFDGSFFVLNVPLVVGTKSFNYISQLFIRSKWSRLSNIHSEIWGERKVFN